MRIRDYRDDDLPAVLALNLHATDPSADVRDSARFNPDLLKIPDVYQRGGCFLVGEVSGELMAMAGLEPQPDGVFILTRVRVAIPHQRKGHGLALVRECERRAAGLGGREIILDTTERQVPAQKLYVEAGFSETHRSVLKNEFGEFKLVHYRKALR